MARRNTKIAVVGEVTASLSKMDKTLITNVKMSRPLENARREILAQTLAEGPITQLMAYAIAFRRQLGNVEKEQWVRGLTAVQRREIHKVCGKPEIKARVAVLLAERSAQRQRLGNQRFHITKDYVIGNLLDIAARCMQAVPVLNAKGEHLGIYQLDGNGAIKAFELIGREEGMFAQQHKHLHGQMNPLEGTENELLARIRVFTSKLSDADLLELGLQRVDIVNVPPQ